MKKLIASFALTVGLLGLSTGIVAAHHAIVTGCEQVTFDSNIGWTAKIGDQTYGPFTIDGDNGPFHADANPYAIYQFYEPDGTPEAQGIIVIPACPKPSPTASPTPVPTSTATPRPVPSSAVHTPRPTPPATAESSTPSNQENSTIDFVIGLIMGTIGGGIIFLAMTRGTNRRR